MTPQALVIDLAQKTLAEVVALLEANRFDISTNDGSIIGSLDDETPRPEPHSEDGQATVVWVNDEQAPFLTVQLFGQTMSLEPGFALYFYHDMAAGRALETGEWSVINPLNLRR